MFSRLATVLQELSGEEGQDGDQQGMLVPQVPADESPVDSEVPEDAMERLAHLEQLVVQLKELIRDKDTQLKQKDTELSSKDAQLQNEREEADARFTKLKLQAKAKMASLNKQITELKGQGELLQSPDSSFTGAGAAVEEELKELRSKLSEEEVHSRELQERLQATEQLLQEKEAAHAEQLRVLQAVVCEKDVRFQEQIQKHEEELLRVTAQSHNDGELQQALQVAKQLEAALSSRSQELEMLQQEVSSADQQKQILTAQFRQMEQELSEAVRLREEDGQRWAERAGRADAELAALRASLEALEKERTDLARQENELVSLREAKHLAEEALEKEKREVTRLEAELAAVQALSDASERDKEDIARLESELASMRGAESAAVRAGQDALDKERSEVDQLEKELETLREEREATQKKTEVLVEIWRHLRPFALETVSEEIPVPADLSLVLDAVQSVETRLTNLTDESSERNEQCAHLTRSLETLQEQLERKTAEQEEAAAKIQQLEDQVEKMLDRNDVPEPPLDSSETEKAHILALEQQLLEKDNELAALRESLLLAAEHSSNEVTSGETHHQAPDQDVGADPPDGSAALPDFMEDPQEEEGTALVAEDASVLSLSAGNESSPELIGHQSESPEESKGGSSDEMVASSDSEVAHSSWTLLEAVNQDGGQEWPSVSQDFARSWVATGMEQEASTVQTRSSPETIAETLQQSSSSSSAVADVSSSLFAQALAEELQKRYSELLAELEELKEAAAESQERIRSLEEETQSLTAAKEEAQAQARDFSTELESVREELDRCSQQNISEVGKQSVEMQLLEEQMSVLDGQNNAKEEKIRDLRADLEMAQRALSEQENQARMLSAQLEDRELLSSELERRLQDMENSMLEYSQTSDLNNESLLKKDSEINELQLRISQKEKEVTELNDSMSARLLQAEEEKIQVDGEVIRLREQIAELQVIRDEKQQAPFEDSAAHVGDELASLQKEKGDLEVQLANMKKKLQAALVQRKELMKKVNELEKEATRLKEKDETVTGGTPENIPHVEKAQEKEIQEMETKVLELKEALRSKEEAVETLEQKLSQQDQALAEMLALNTKLSEEAENFQQAAGLQSQVASLEAECEALHKKVQEAQESRKETIRKAKEKDRHHREQLKQQKEEYNELMQRFEAQSGEQEALLTKLRELEEKCSAGRDDLPAKGSRDENLQKPAQNDWVQEEWVDFAASETDSSKPQSGGAESAELLPAQVEEPLKALREEIQTVRMANAELEKQLEEAHAGLSRGESEISELGKELQALREKERQIDELLEEISDLRQKYQQAQTYAETLKAEMEAATKASEESSVATLQAEVEDFKHFLDNKNQEILELSNQLGEQSALIRSMQVAVSQKDELVTSLQEELKAEQEKTQKLEAELPQKQEEEEDSETKIQQLQRKLHAALVSRKEALKENKTQKEQLASAEKVIAELQQKIDSAEDELEKLRTERVRLIDEVDRTLLENQSLGSSCESLKLAMEGLLNEKEARGREVEMAKEEAARMCREWEEKVQEMKEEYETLLKSYENVSDEAERVRKVLEAARQERQELSAKVRTHEAARQEAERQAEEAQKEVDSVKDKMRKFAKTKQLKILELEEENERLRELQERPATKREDKALRAELDELQEEVAALKSELDATAAERDSLGHQVEDLRDQLVQIKERDREISVTAPSSAAVAVEMVAAQQSDATVTSAAPVESGNEVRNKLTPEDTRDDQVVAVETHVEPDEGKEKPEVTGRVQASFEDKAREIEEAVAAERQLWQQREAELRAQLASLEGDLQESQEKESITASLEKCIQEGKEREKSLIEEASNRETQFKELLRNLECEKDNLEERLMNQLAQLNGSIAGYQQELADDRERLTELQREVERLERERAELEAGARSERDRAARLEEDMRQAQRERAEAEAESGKQRELEQQLRSAQRVKEGSQSRARQLEELLREKQLEVRQLQKDCIQYQERISELAREAKALQLGHSELGSKLQQSQLETSATLEDLRRLEAEMAACKNQLAEAQKQASEALAAKLTVEQSIQERETVLKTEAEKTLDSVRFRLGAELKEIELRLEEAYTEKEKEEEATQLARHMAEGAERRAQEMQARLDESLARLAAFSRCMSSLQDDRDRVLDEARQWETRFNGALQSKEAEVREAETRAKELADQLQKETALKEELELSVNRLEKADKDWQLRLEEEEKKVAEHQAALAEERMKLEETTAELQSAQTEAQALKKEVESLHQRTRALEEAVGRLQGDVGQARTELRDREAEERRLCLNVEHLETDLRSSKALTESLQNELHEKERREVEMLGEKEQAVAQAAEEARKEADTRAEEAEEELEKKRGEVRDLEEKLRKAEEESNGRKTRLDSFMKAMGSLQDDRDRVLNMYKQLEEKHLQVMMEKDGLIQEAAGENNSLKEELRSLLVQRDDLYAERAKLSAQLHGYRDELNQVLSMKDSQHKQLLAAQRERIASLERERDELEAQLKSLSRAREAEVEAAQRVESETLSRASKVMDAPGAEVEKLREQLQAARAQAEALEVSLLREQQEHESKSKELAELQWEGGVMRTESESAQERVAELARDLLAVEQRLLEETETTKQLRAENQSFAKAMASLQDSRDKAASEARELSLKLEEVSKAGVPAAQSSSGGSGGEVWGLKNALQALQNDRERLLDQLKTQTTELKRQKSELARLGAGELIKVSQELFEEKKKNEDMLGAVTQLENVVEVGKQEIETLRLERMDWVAQAEQLKQQTLATLSERDQQLRRLGAMLAEAQAQKPKLQQEHYQRQGAEERDSAPGAPQERSSLQDSHAHVAELKDLQRRLEDETQRRISVEEQLVATQDRLKRQAAWHSQDGDQSETAVFIEPSEGSVTRTRRGGPGVMRMLRAAFCSRQRTPLLFGLYLLTVHVLLVLSLGGFL